MDQSEVDENTSSGVHFPPPFIYAGLFVCGIGLERVLPSPGLPRTFELGSGILLVALGLGLVFWSIGLFVLHRTNPLPMLPTRKMVFSGPYRLSRNPMYLGMLLLYLGLAFWSSMFWPLVLAPLILPVVNALVIRKEERYLLARFGDSYGEYLTRVRRWI